MKNAYLSSSKLVDILSQQFENKSLQLCVSAVAFEKPGKRVIVSLSMTSLSYPQYTPPTSICF